MSFKIKLLCAFVVQKFCFLIGFSAANVGREGISYV